MTNCRVCKSDGHFFLCNTHWKCARPAPQLDLTPIPQGSAPTEQENHPWPQPR